MRFSTPSFFHHSNRPGSLTNGLKYFCFWFPFRRDFLIFPSDSLLRGVNGHFLKLLHRPSKGQCHINSDKAKKGLHFSFLAHSPRMKLFFDSAQYDTARSQFFQY